MISMNSLTASGLFLFLSGCFNLDNLLKAFFILDIGASASICKISWGTNPLSISTFLIFSYESQHKYQTRLIIINSMDEPDQSLGGSGAFLLRLKKRL